MPELNLGLGGSNPYVQNQATALTAQSNQNLAQNVMPGIGQGAQLAGGYGGSRQGIAQGVAAGNAQTGLDASIAGLYSNAYGQDQNAQIQRAKIDSDNAMAQSNLQVQRMAQQNSHDLGLRSSDLGFANLDANIAQNNFGNQLASANFGMGAYNSMNGQTQAGIQAGTNIQNTPLDYQKYFTNSANGIGSGFASSTDSFTAQGNPYMSAMGGAMMGNNLYNQYNRG